VQDGDTINLMVKPGVEWDPAAAVVKPKELPSLLLSGASPLQGSASLSPGPPEKDRKRGHSRIPSVVLSTPSSPLEKPQDIQLVDGDGYTLSADMPTESPTPQSTYSSAVSQPEYWIKLLAFLRFVSPRDLRTLLHVYSDLTEPPFALRSEFPNRGDASNAFEDYLAASKGVLTASEIAKIRDSVGVTGMAGT
jgi:UV excision repair protein RAD23